jgi:glucose/arabinose dehydrogenase
VVNSIPTCCDHVTRAIVFDAKGRFYVQLGSGSNVDPNSDVPLPTPRKCAIWWRPTLVAIEDSPQATLLRQHARIHRFNITSIPKGGFNWSAGEIFADGLRNEVGLRYRGCSLHTRSLALERALASRE